MNCAPLSPASHAAAAAAAAERTPNLDPVTRFNDAERRKGDGDPPLLSLSATLPTCELTGQKSGASETSSPPRSPLQTVTSPTCHRAATRPPEPVHESASSWTADTSYTAPMPSDALTDDAKLVSLIERFQQLLTPSTERLVRLRGVLRGLRDGLSGPSPSTPMPNASPPMSPSLPHDLSIASSRPSSTLADSAAAAATTVAANPPRLCVTGVSDSDMDEVFQFLLHRDPTAARGGSGGASGGGGGRSGLNSANSAARPPTPDNVWVVPSHQSPVAPVPQRRLRTEALAAAGEASTAGHEVNASAAVSSNASAAMAVSISGLLESSNATLSDGAPETGMGGAVGGDFPTTPPPPPAGFARVAAEVGRSRVSPRLTDSPSPEHFALPMLHHRSESGILKAGTQDRSAETPVDARGTTPHLPSASHSTFTHPPTSATVSMLTAAAPLAGGAGGAVRVPAAPTGIAALSHPRSISPHPPLLVNSLHGEGGGTTGLASPAAAASAATHTSPSPPLPAAPANHHLRSVKPTLSLESRTLGSPPGAATIHSGGDAPAMAPLPPSTHDDERHATSVPAEENAAANLSSTLPDLGDTPPPTALTPHAPLSPSSGSHHGGTPPHRLSGGGHAANVPHPLSPSDFSESPLAVHSGGFRRRTAPHPSLPAPAALPAGDSPAAPTPMVTVLLHRTASQYSESSDHQRSFLGSLPSPGTGRFNTLPTPFFSRASGVSGAASSAGRSLRDDSTLLSPGSSFSPAAARFVQRLRRRTAALSPAHLRFSVWNLFHLDELTAQDRALLRAARSSFSTVGSPERVGRGSKGGPAAAKRISGEDHLSSPSTANGGDGGDRARVHHRRSSPKLSSFNGTPLPAVVASQPPWMVGISEEGILRYEALPTLHAATPVPQSPPIATTADHCLLCVPFEAVRELSQEPTRDNVYGGAAAGAAASDAAAEVTRTLNLFFGPFTPPRQRQRSAPAPATSILVNAEHTSNSSSPAPAVPAGDTPIPLVSSPTISVLASPNHETVGTFGFPALGQKSSGSEAGLRTPVRSWRKSPSPSHDKLFSGATGDGRSPAVTVPMAGGGGAAGTEGRASRGQRAEPPRNSGLSSASARTAATLRRAATDRLGVNSNGASSNGHAAPTSGDGGGGGSPARGSSSNASMGDGGGDPHPSLMPGAGRDGVADDWLCVLRQAMVQRVVFVLVQSDPQTFTPPPPTPGPPLVPHSPKRLTSSSTTPDSDDTHSPGGVPTPPSLTPDAVVRRFVALVKAWYGVTVPSWRVVVFNYRSGVLTRNFLLSYFGYTHASGQPRGGQRWSRDEDGVRTDELIDTTAGDGEGPGSALPGTVSTPGSYRLGERESANATGDVRQPATPPLLLNGSAAHAVSPLLKTLVPTPPDGVVTTSPGGSLRGPRQSSRHSLLRSASRLNLTGSLQTSAEAPLATPEVDGRSATPATPATAGEERSGVAVPLDADGARVAHLLFALLTRDIAVAPLPTSLAAYAPLMPQLPTNNSVTQQRQPQQLPPSSPLCKPMPHFLRTGAGGHGLSAEEGTSIGSVVAGTSAAAAASSVGGASDGLPTILEYNHGSSRALSVSSVSEGRQEGESGSLTREEWTQSTAACTHALTVMWRDSGAAALHSAFRLFEHDATAHRVGRCAFSLMAWSWQLSALLPAVVQEAQQRCSRLRNTRRHALQKLEGVQRSIAAHRGGGPASNVAALEARVQGGFAAMTQRFAHDVRRLLVAPSSPSSAATSATTTTTTTAAMAASTASVASNATGLASSTGRPAGVGTYPPLDALRAYETPALREAYRRLVYCVRQFRDFYISGQLPAEARGEDHGLSTDTLSSSQRGSLSDESGGRWNVSLYEVRYTALRDDAAESLSPLANTSTSTRAASVSAAHAPPAPVNGVSGQRRGSRSAPPPPRLGDAGAEVEEQAMPRVDRSVPRERHVSLIASAASSASASMLNSSSGSRSRPSLSEMTAPATAPRDATAAVLPTLLVNDEGTNSGNTGNCPASAQQSKQRRASKEAVAAPRRASLPSRAELLQRRLLMEHQLIAHVSQLNTELINFFLATCVAALPYIQRSCVQAEIERVKASHAAMYSAFATAVHGHKDAAMSMAQAYASLEQWAAEVGPLLSMVRSRPYLEKFIVQLRAVLCEDQIRGLAVFRGTRDGDGGIGCSGGDGGQAAQLTHVNLARHCTAIATSDSRAHEERARLAQRRASLTGRRVTSADARTAALTSEVGVRSAKLLLYYTRLACKPKHMHGTTAEAVAASSLRHGRPASALSTSVTSHASPSRSRGGGRGGLGDTVSLTSMSAAWNREEEESVARHAVHRKGVKGSQRSPQRGSAAAPTEGNHVGDGFYAASSQPCMAAVAPQLMAALSGIASPGAAAVESATFAALSSPRAQSSGGNGGSGGTDGGEASVLTSSTSPSPHASATQRHRRLSAQLGGSTRSAAEGGGGAASAMSDALSPAWRSRLSKWRARMAEAERPVDIAAAPLLWLLLDAWDETVLRLPYGLLLHLDTARYGESLNALSGPVMESQRSHEEKLTESAKSAARQLAALEGDVRRLTGEGGETRAAYAAALKSIFDDATALAMPHDESPPARFFA